MIFDRHLLSATVSCAAREARRMKIKQFLFWNLFLSTAAVINTRVTFGADLSLCSQMSEADHLNLCCQKIDGWNYHHQFCCFFFLFLFFLYLVFSSCTVLYKYNYYDIEQGSSLVLLTIGKKTVRTRQYEQKYIIPTILYNFCKFIFTCKN